MIPMLFVALALHSSPADAAPPQDRSRRLQPVTNGWPWIRSVDYPSSLLKAGKAGITNFRLDIDGDGKVVGCTVIGSSGWPELDAKSCRLLLARAKFVPARDASGAGIPATYHDRVVWELGAKVALPRASWSRTSSFESNSWGLLTGCALADKGNITSGFFALCEIPFSTASEQAKGIGTPVASRRFMRRVAQSINGVSADDFVPPAGAVAIDTATMRYTVAASGKVRGCVLERRLRGTAMKPAACVAGPYDALPIDSPDAKVEWTLSTWETGPAPDATVPKTR